MVTASAVENKGRGGNGITLERLIGELEELCSRGREGERLPTRSQLMETYNASERTVLRALDVLERSDKIVRRQGWGVFISRPSVDENRPAPAVTNDNLPGWLTAPVRSGVIGLTAFLDESVMGSGQDNPATLATLRAMEGECRSVGRTAKFLNRWRANAPELSPAQGVRELLSQGADAVIVLDLYTHPYVLSELGAMRDLPDLPVVYVSNVDHYVPCSHVSFDNRDAGYRAAEMLLNAGHKEIVFLSPYDGRWVDLRVEGAAIAAQRAGVPFRVYPTGEYIEVNSPETTEVVTGVVRRMVAEGEARGGIVAAHDRVARDLMEAAETVGLEAGRDFGLVGFDDDPRSFTVGLSTMRPPFEALGVEAVRMVASCLAEGSWNKMVKLRAESVARSTHAVAVAATVNGAFVEA